MYWEEMFQRNPAAWKLIVPCLKQPALRVVFVNSGEMSVWAPYGFCQRDCKLTPAPLRRFFALSQSLLRQNPIWRPDDVSGDSKRKGGGRSEGWRMKGGGWGWGSELFIPPNFPPKVSKLAFWHGNRKQQERLNRYLESYRIFSHFAWVESERRYDI